MKAVPSSVVKHATMLMQEGLSTRDTAQRLGISHATAGRIRSDNKENMPINKAGRPRKIPAETVEYLKLNVKSGVLKTVVEAKSKANEILPEAVSASTVRRRLRESGLIAKKIVKRPALRKKHVSARLQFVKKYKEWTEEDWAMVVWSDESKINRICSDGIQWAWNDQPGRLTGRTVQQSSSVHFLHFFTDCNRA